jgi:hypothetical protein
MTANTTTQAQLDADTYAAYQANGENKSETGRVLGIGASTVADRIKRHQARAAQDAADAETEAEAAVQDTPAGDDSGDQAADGTREVEFAGTREDEAGEPEADPEPAAPAKAEKVLATECEECGFKFSKPQVRKTCQSGKACKGRQDAKAAPAGE